ncbi:MAG: hypothetical protein JW384_02596 [Nitrosomonadaceae bacterium]|nr:hypothetical protein [Nitrosomonadaceae bacterium]
MLKEYLIGVADSSVMRVYSAAGQTRLALIVVSAMAVLPNTNNRAPIPNVERRAFNVEINKGLRQVKTAAI